LGEIVILGEINKIIRTIPKEVLGKLNLSSSIYNSNDNKIEVTILFGEKTVEVREFIKSIGGEFNDLGYGFGIVLIPINKLEDLAKNENVQYIELPKSLYLTDIESNKAICADRVRNEYGLYGEGIVIGFIDTGIDYTHPAFRNDDGSTRIEYIYDLSMNGAIYDKNKINEALLQDDPFKIVPFYDVIEHGTHVAGIACAGGKINPKYYGVAPKSSIMMVKSSRGLFSLSTYIMKGIKFLIDKASELKMPLVINLSLSTNDGAHNGSSLLEQYINTIATLERVTIAVAAGNEGNAAHHVGGNLEKENVVTFNVSQGETAVVINLYKSILPKVSLELIAPTGVSSGAIIIEEGFNTGVISGNQYQIYNTGPRPFDISGEIGISLISEGNIIIPGQWKIIMKIINEYEGIFDMWLPISEGLNENTKFLNPTVNNTLGIPATVYGVISVGSYNYITRNISPFSGRGRVSYYDESKPDLVAPGEGISSVAPNGSFDRKSGTSMATPHVSGLAALMMEWGIIRRNDIFLFGDRLKYYLILGAKKERRDIVYPDPSFGYGEVCLYDTMGILESTLNIIKGESYRDNRLILDGYDDLVEFYKLYSDKSEIVSFLVELSVPSEFLKANNIPNVSTVVLNESYGIIFTPVGEIDEISKYIKRFINPYLPQIYTLNNITPLEASNAINFHNNPYLNLDGRGVLIAILDTGIDYLNEEFQREDGTTRILRIWDQTIDSKGDIYGVKLGTEYTREQINEAIKASRNGEDPYKIVPSKDENGHGTMAAGIAGARGQNETVIGAAPAVDFVIVKLKEINNNMLKYSGVDADNRWKYDSTNILLANRYVSLVSSEMKRPVVLLFNLGTNIGAHDGKDEISGSIDVFSRQARAICVTGTGNQGDTDTHFEGTFNEIGNKSTIEIKISEKQKSLGFQIWAKIPDVIAVSIVSPSGEIIDKISSKTTHAERVKFVYEGTEMMIKYDLSNEQNGNESIGIKAFNLKPGIWKFIIYGEYLVNMKYWSWLPQRELLNGDTKFLEPNQYITLTIPSVSDTALSVAYYNQNNNATVGSSGRGYTLDGTIKPDIAAGGINAPIIKLNGGVGVSSGSSVAASLVAGICALILEWAVIDNNKPEIYSKEITSYVIRGVNTRKGDSYPNPEWGYGTIDVNKVFEALRGEYNRNSKNEKKYEEYNLRNLFIRIPINQSQ